MSIERFNRLAAAAYKDGATVRCKGFDKEPRNGWRSVFFKWAVRQSWLGPKGEDADLLFDEWRQGWLDANYDLHHGKAVFSTRLGRPITDGAR